MAYTIQLYKDLLSTGSNIEVPSDMFIPTVLKDLAAISKSKGTLLTISNAGSLAPSTLKELAAIGSNSICFKFL